MKRKGVNPLKKYKYKIITLIFLSLLFIGMLTIEASAKQTLESAFSDFLAEWRVALAGVSGFGALTSILVFIWHFIVMAHVPAHPKARREALLNMVWSGVCTALLGSLTLILTLFYSIIFL
jgi:hypothetical protein